MVVKQHCVWVRKHRHPPRIPFALRQRMLFPQKRGGKERFGAAGKEPSLLAVVGMSLWDPQGLWEPKPRVPPTACTGTAGGKAEGVRISMGCGWRMASSPTVNFFTYMCSKWHRYGLSLVRSLLVWFGSFFPLLWGEKQEPFCSYFAFPFTLHFLTRLDFPFSPRVPIFLCCFSCCPSDEYRSPWLLYSTVPRTTFIYICSWNQDGKNSLKAMEIVREGSIMHCALLSWIAKRWKPCWLELTFPMSQSQPAAH